MPHAHLPELAKKVMLSISDGHQGGDREKRMSSDFPKSPELQENKGPYGNVCMGW